MRAVVCRELSPDPSNLELAEVESPAIQPGHVRVDVHSAGINFADTLIIKGEYQVKADLPFSPGLEIAGVISEVGEGVPDNMLGMRVAGLCGVGGYAEEVVMPAMSVVPIPDNMSFDIGAGFAVAYGTSHIALRHRGRLKSGETLLVHGASGGVGLTAVEIGKKLGATVIATGGSDKKLEVPTAYGADHVINYREENVRDRVKELTGGRGVDVVYDPVGGDIFDQSLRAIAWEGRLLVIGFASGRIPKVPANYLLVKNCSVLGVYWGAYATKDPGVMAGSIMELVSWFREGEIKPHVSATYPLAAAGQALQDMLDRKVTGKIVLRVRES